MAKKITSLCPFAFPRVDSAIRDMVMSFSATQGMGREEKSFCCSEKSFHPRAGASMTSPVSGSTRPGIPIARAPTSSILRPQLFTCDSIARFSSPIWGVEGKVASLRIFPPFSTISAVFVPPTSSPTKVRSLLKAIASCCFIIQHSKSFP